MLAGALTAIAGPIGLSPASAAAYVGGDERGRQTAPARCARWWLDAATGDTVTSWPSPWTVTLTDRADPTIDKNLTIRGNGPAQS